MTIFEIAEAIREACAIQCHERASDFARDIKDKDGVAKHEGAFQAGMSIRSLDLSAILAQFDDVVVVPKTTLEQIEAVNACMGADWFFRLATWCALNPPNVDAERARLKEFAAAQERRHD